LHWDGLNRSLREVVISGAIGDGMTYKTWPQVRDNLVAMEDFMRLQQPPPSPLRVDAALAEDGKKIFDATCASCHARKIPGPEGLPNPRFRTVIPQIEVGTDRHRLDMWSEPARERYTAYQSDYPWELKAFVNEDGYVATELNGLWLRGPYLHNGSVPTLADLLKPAKERPAKFYRGCDLVDAEKGGFACTADDGWLYDTAEKGNSNAGHEMSNDLSGAQKDALLAYLKTL
jgi:hypothetical protein